MNWFDQHRLKNILIVLLLLMNIITLSIVWMKERSTAATPPEPRVNSASESVQAMKEVVGFSEEQSQKFTALLKDYREQTRPVNERMNLLKLDLAEHVFSTDGTADSAARVSAEIAGLQQQLEQLRFEHFRRVAALCDTRQRERLRPVLQQLFSRRPPKEDQGPVRSAPVQRNDPPEVRAPQRNRDQQQEGRSVPPPIEEKVQKYSDRLDLSPEQRRQLTELLTSLRQEGKAQRQQRDGKEEKERMRRMEDERVMQILTPQQQAEFRKMLERRRQ